MIHAGMETGWGTFLPDPDQGSHAAGTQAADLFQCQDAVVSRTAAAYAEVIFQFVQQP
jgi:hypothetical protein